MKLFKQYSSLREALFVATRPALWNRRAFTRDQLDVDPFRQFNLWFERAKKAVSLEFPNAMCLGSIDEEGFPDSRMVLMKSVDHLGFVFYTNYQSAKGRALLETPKASLLFYWEPLQRQVRVQGAVEIIPESEADQYFSSRPRESQLGAWASAQSAVIRNREELEERVREVRERFRGKPVPRPEYWSGFRVVPHRFEFWQLRLSRLHDRFRYLRSEDGRWEIERLSP
jgi:pyridoxamine 5'-phosphate oxidase